MNFLMRLIVTAAATAVAVWMVPGLDLTASDTTDKVLTLLAVALIFGIVNALVRPVVQVLTGCLVLLTLGLFLLVINAAMLMLTGYLAEKFGLGFEVAGFWPAFWGSLVISIVATVLNGILGTGKSAS